MLGVIGIEGVIQEQFHFRPLFTKFVKCIKDIFNSE
jgi:hypothetical protein